MKNAMLYLFMISVLFMGQAQEPKQQQEEYGLLEAIETGDYLDSIVETYPNEFQKDAVEFLKSRVDLPALAADLKKQGENGENGYTISCKNKNGNIFAEFDENGEIIIAVQTFKDIPLPHAIMADISRDSPGWEVTQTVFKCISKEDREDKKRYVIKLKKDNKKKTLRIKPALNKGLSKL